MLLADKLLKVLLKWLYSSWARLKRWCLTSINSCLALRSFSAEAKYDLNISSCNDLHSDLGSVSWVRSVRKQKTELVSNFEAISLGSLLEQFRPFLFQMRSIFGYLSFSFSRHLTTKGYICAIFRPSGTFLWSFRPILVLYGHFFSIGAQLKCFCKFFVVSSGLVCHPRNILF